MREKNDIKLKIERDEINKNKKKNCVKKEKRKDMKPKRINC